MKRKKHPYFSSYLCAFAPTLRERQGRMRETNPILNQQRHLCKS
ncbi:hypothetical protein [Nostoc sp. CMAA1605]|nr:hypothetical protein [Nostoc sp. CMAA1605]